MKGIMFVHCSVLKSRICNIVCYISLRCRWFQKFIDALHKCTSRTVLPDFLVLYRGSAYGGHFHLFLFLTSDLSAYLAILVPLTLLISLRTITCICILTLLRTAKTAAGYPLLINTSMINTSFWLTRDDFQAHCVSKVRADSFFHKKVTLFASQLGYLE